MSPDSMLRQTRKQDARGAFLRRALLLTGVTGCILNCLLGHLLLEKVAVWQAEVARSEQEAYRALSLFMDIGVPRLATVCTYLDDPREHIRWAASTVLLGFQAEEIPPDCLARAHSDWRVKATCLAIRADAGTVEAARAIRDWFRAAPRGSPEYWLLSKLLALGRFREAGDEAAQCLRTAAGTDQRRQVGRLESLLRVGAARWQAKSFNTSWWEADSVGRSQYIETLVQTWHKYRGDYRSIDEYTASDKFLPPMDAARDHRGLLAWWLLMACPLSLACLAVILMGLSRRRARRLGSDECGHGQGEHARGFASTGLFGILVSLCLTTTSPAAAEKGPVLTDDEVKRRITDFLNRLQCGWTPPGEAAAWPVQRCYDMVYRERVVKAGGFEIGEESGHIYSFLNYRTRPLSTSLPDGKSEGPRLTVQIVKEKALAMLKRFDEKLLEHLQEGQVTYEAEREMPRAIPWWRVRWRLRFGEWDCFEDFCQVSIYDDGVIMGMIVTVCAIPPAQPVMKTRPAEALAAAKGEVIGGELAAKWNVTKPTLEKGQVISRMWVRPNEFIIAGRDEPTGLKARLLRLAWVVRFPATIAGREGNVDVWIDVEDGEFLGACF